MLAFPQSDESKGLKPRIALLVFTVTSPYTPQNACLSSVSVATFLLPYNASVPSTPTLPNPRYPRTRFILNVCSPESPFHKSPSHSVKHHLSDNVTACSQHHFRSAESIDIGDVGSNWCPPLSRPSVVIPPPRTSSGPFTETLRYSPPKRKLIAPLCNIHQRRAAFRIYGV